eukprot:10874428-Alexandrium_andersonii.AAC.1
MSAVALAGPLSLPLPFAGGEEGIGLLEVGLNVLVGHVEVAATAKGPPVSFAAPLEPTATLALSEAALPNELANK